MGNELNLDEAYAALADAACAVIERWDSPAWKDLPHTGESINALRRALAGVVSVSAAAQGHAQQQEAEEIERLRKDAERLNWLDATNRRFRMGWYAGIAPVGNVMISSVVMGTTDIRSAIDSAKADQEAKSGD